MKLALRIFAFAIVVAGALFPFSKLSASLGFVPLPAAYFGFLLLATGTYLILVEFVKRRLFDVRSPAPTGP